MGRKSSAKGQPLPPPAKPKRSLAPAFLAAAGVGVVALGGAIYWQQQQNAASQATAAAVPVYAPLPATLTPHHQDQLPAIELPAYQTTRSPEVIRAAYQFAAEHPEVLSYVPCFCGCQRQGHRGNEDCFVRARDINGDVIEWEPHGMDCEVCIDVATRAAALFKSGKSVKDIRDTIEHDWAGRTGEHTPTPPAPSN